MSVQHTPGPWANLRPNAKDHTPLIGKRGPFGRHIAEVLWSDDQGQADARLIAAAPELLAACSGWIDWLDGDGWIENAADHETRMLDAMRSAIAKARGETA